MFWDSAAGVALIGAAAAFALVGLRDWRRNRQDLSLEVVDGRAFYATFGSVFMASIRVEERWDYCDLTPENGVEGRSADEGLRAELRIGPEDASLFLVLDLLLQNRSWRDDALTTCRLVLYRRDGLAPSPPALVKLDRRFFGENVPAHSLRDLHLLFRIDGQIFGTIPEFRYQRSTVFQLDAKTIRGHEFKIDVAPAAFTLGWDPEWPRADLLDPYLDLPHP